MRIQASATLACLALAGCGGSSSDAEPIAPPPTLQLTLAVTSTASLSFVGTQDGSGAWKPVPAASPGENAVLLSGKFYGVAYGCTSGVNLEIHVLHATLDEGTRVEVSCRLGQAETIVGVSGSVQGLGAGQSAQLDVAGRVAMVSAPGSFMLDVPAGSFDAFARRFTSAPAFDSVIRRNDVALSAGAMLDFDFAADPTAFAPDSNTIAIDNATGNETTSVLVVLQSPSHDSFSLGAFPPAAVLTLPAAELRADELHSVVVGATDTTSGAQRAFRQLLRAGQAFSADLPDLPDVPTFSVGSSSPYLRPAFTIPPQTPENEVALRFTQLSGTLSWEVSLSRGYLSGKTSYTLPDLSGIPLFDVHSALATGVPTSWRRFAQRAATAVAELLEPSRPLVDGASYRTTALSGTQSF